MIISKHLVTPEIREFPADGEAIRVPVYGFNTVVVGSGAAGLNCADLISEGGGAVAIVTEGLKMGTSRNTGSDKQTYYKLTLSGGAPDSVEAMAQSLFDGGSTDGDLALCEAANSTRAFMRLVSLGVPFPRNEYGEFAGYQTDHDTRTRATSCGPLTSKYMTEALEKSVLAKDIPIFDNFRVIKILTKESKVCGILAVCPDDIVYNKFGFVLFSAVNTVWATGGPSAIYSATVYPESQTCAHGTALEAGASAVNVTESQYGLASVKFRWNLSGTYQQVLPRYISTAPDGSDEREFLDDTFADTTEMLTAVFRKGYQWPFDPAKLYTRDGLRGSSLVDIAVFNERQKGRKVYIDYRRNPSKADRNGSLDFSLLGDEARNYLENSGALLASPIERLAKMNAPAIELYRSHGIDLAGEPLEIDMCAQHNNGGFEVNTDYESVSLAHFFVVGEAAGVFGVHRPGGSALNSTQVGSLRAAEKILSDAEYSATADSTCIEAGTFIKTLSGAFGAGGLSRDEILAKRAHFASRMTECGAFIRNEVKIRAAIDEIKRELSLFGEYKVADSRLFIELSINRDILITQYVYLSAIIEYISHGGKSRGSYLIEKSGGGISAGMPIEVDGIHSALICESVLNDGEVLFNWRPVRQIPARDNWFENVYNAYRRKYRL